MTRLTEPEITEQMKRSVDRTLAHEASMQLGGVAPEVSLYWCFILVSAQRLSRLKGKDAVVHALRATADKLEAA